MKNYEISTKYECVEKLSMTIGCNNWMICLELIWFFTIRVECCNFLHLYGRYVLDRNKISSDQSLYPLKFFANTSFKNPFFLYCKMAFCELSNHHQFKTYELNRYFNLWKKSINRLNLSQIKSGEMI